MKIQVILWLVVKKKKKHIHILKFYFQYVKGRF